MQAHFVSFEQGDPDSPDVVAVRSDTITKIEYAGGVYNQQPVTTIHYGDAESIVANEDLERVVAKVNAALSGQPPQVPQQEVIGRRPIGR